MNERLISICDLGGTPTYIDGMVRSSEPGRLEFGAFGHDLKGIHL